MNNFSAAGNVTIDKTQTCVLYDQSTGKISHAHTVVSLKGAPVRDAAEVEKEAYERASRADNDVGGLKALHLTNTPLSSPSGYRVDVARGVLIELESVRESKPWFASGDVVVRVLLIALAIAVVWLIFR